MAAEVDRDARYKLAQALAANPGNISAAARASGYSRRQVYRVKEDPEFQKMLEAAQKGLAGAPADDGLRTLALGRLRKVLEDDAAEHRDHIAAAKVALGVTPQPKPVTATAPDAPPPTDHEAEKLRVLDGAKKFLANRTKKGS